MALRDVDRRAAFLQSNYTDKLPNMVRKAIHFFIGLNATIHVDFIQVNVRVVASSEPFARVSDMVEARALSISEIFCKDSPSMGELAMHSFFAGELCVCRRQWRLVGMTPKIWFFPLRIAKIYDLRGVW